MLMTSEIQNYFQKISNEQLCNHTPIKILFAVESGSRVWGLDSPDSDYDIRFVFYRSAKEYFRINIPKDIITRTYETTEGLFDFVGFDIFKFVRLLAKSNPNMLEWVISDIQYLGKPPAQLQQFAKSHFNPITLYHHYKSIARNDYQQFIQRNKDVSVKRYVYVMRGFYSALWVSTNPHALPPLSLKTTVDYLKDLQPSIITEETQKLIQKKRVSFDRAPINRIPVLDEFIEHFLSHDDPVLHRKSPDLSLLDQTLQEVVI